MLGNILKYFPQELVRELEEFADEPVEELRLRFKGESTVYINGCERGLKYAPDEAELEEIVLRLAKRSLYAFMDELKQGFFSIEGGIRIGVAGRIVSEEKKITHIRNFTSLNIRFPKEIRGISEAVMPFITRRRKIISTLIVSPPQMGKTTLLRDIVRNISDSGVKCCIVDERCELWGQGCFDVGKRTDVLTACPKEEGMRLALRSLSPMVIATDELGRQEELLALSDAANAGVEVIATAHGGDIHELMNRAFFNKLIKLKSIGRIVVLSDSLGRGTVQRVYDGELNTVCNIPFLLKEEGGL